MKSIIIKSALLLLLVFIGIFNLEGQTNSDISLVVNDSMNYPITNQPVNIPYGTVPEDQTLGAMEVFNPSNIDLYNDHQTILDVLNGMIPGFYNNTIRGQKTYLITVDGIPRSSNSMSSDFDFIRNMSIQEVEQITVLKDATAAMLYGSKAKDGVIQITTKRGREGQTEMNVRAESGIRTPISYPQYLNAADYMTFYNQALKNDGQDRRYSDGAIDSTRNGLDPIKYPNEEFFNSDYLRNYSNYFRFSADAAGGNDKTVYYSMLSWMNEKDLYSVGQNGKNFSNNQFTFRGNVKYEINDWMKANLDAFVLFGADRQPSGNFWQDATTHLPNSYPLTLPTSAITDSAILGAAKILDGGYILGGTNQYQNNIYGNFMLGGYQTLTNRTSQINFGLDFNLNNILEGLSAKAFLSYDIMNSFIISFDNDYAVYEPLFVTNYSGTADSLVLNKIGIDRANQTQNLSEPLAERRFGLYSTLDYHKTIGTSHRIDVTALGYWNQANTLGTLYSDKAHHFALRANYSFNNKFIAQLSGLATGSSYLPDNNRYRFSPSLALGYILMDNRNSGDANGVDFLKIQASGGRIHTDIGMPGYYLYNSSFATAGGFKYNRNFGQNNARIYSNVENPNIGLISKNDVNIGLQGSFSGGRLQLKMDAFVSSLDGGVVRRESYYPAFIAILPYENFEKYSDKGIDFGMTINKNSGFLRSSLGMNLSYIIPKAVRVEEPLYATTPWRRLEGQPYDAIFGYVSEGYFSDTAEISKHASQSALGNPTPGDLKYEDKNEDGSINQEDLQIIGNSKPRLQAAVHVNLNYKNFTLFMLGTGQYGSERIFSNSYYWQTGTTIKYSEVVRNSWTQETAEEADYPAIHLNNADNNHVNSTYWIEKDNWFKLHTLQIGYTIPSTKTSFGEGLQVYFRANNLFTISPIKEKLELNIGRPPQMRTFAIGVDMLFSTN